MNLRWNDQTLAGIVDRRLAVVEQDLVVAADGRSMCDLSRRGAPIDVKELEGRQAALAGLRRNLRRAEHDGATTLARDLAEWRSERDRDRGAVWLAYRNGGVNELEALWDDGKAESSD